MTLSAVKNWRTIRARMIMAGIPDPLRSLPDLHAVLDVTEMLLQENMTKKDLDSYMSQMYRPVTLSGWGVKRDPGLEPDPAGFTVDEQRMSFDSGSSLFGKFG